MTPLTAARPTSPGTGLTAGEVVRLDVVGKHFPAGVTALREASLTIAPGEMVAVVGPSGSGKSTMLNLMGTLDLPTTGRVLFEGHDVARLNDRRLSYLRATRIGFVFQQFHLAVGVSVLDNVADGLLYAGIALGERRRLAREVIGEVGLDDRQDHRPSQLSGGERQRVAIARAVLGRPGLLLADEPTGNLDTATGHRIMELLHAVNRAGTAVVVITHDRGLARSFPRRISLLDGAIVGDTG